MLNYNTHAAFGGTWITKSLCVIFNFLERAGGAGRSIDMGEEPAALELVLRCHQQPLESPGVLGTSPGYCPTA